MTRGPFGELRETASPPPESLLQAIWQHQRLLRDRLILQDGRRLRILHPGFWNHEAGPDFRSAVIQFDADPPVSGDLEIDLDPSAWRGHQHEPNPSYQNVILHIVWEGLSKSSLPTLALNPVLDAPIAELALWLQGDVARQLPDHLAGVCTAPLRELSAELRSDLLNQAAQVRLQSKAAHLAARARQAGWEQALWEGLFVALGYKQNIWPLRRLAELRPVIAPEGESASLLRLQARLYGLAGLLPAELKRDFAQADDYVRRLWDEWWRERSLFLDQIMPRSVWRFHGIRPANHPSRRLALAANWLANGNLIPRLEAWFTAAATIDAGALAGSLLKVLQVPEDKFWSRHYTFLSPEMARPQPLLGEARASDLAVNVILPWLWARALAGKNDDLRRIAEARYFAWPAAEDNAVLRLARRRLLGGAPAKSFRTAASQQGLLQIVRDFCDHSNAVCADCRFPELVKNAQIQPSTPGSQS